MFCVLMEGPRGRESSEKQDTEGRTVGANPHEARIRDWPRGSLSQGPGRGPGWHPVEPLPRRPPGGKAGCARPLPTPAPCRDGQNSQLHGTGPGVGGLAGCMPAVTCVRTFASPTDCSAEAWGAVIVLTPPRL